LGDINKSEIKEINAHFRGFYCYSKNKDGSLKAWNLPVLGGLTIACWSVAAFTTRTLGYSTLWHYGSFVPLVTGLVFNHIRQPEQHLHNCYNFLIAKRTATVEL
jgi:hypothetical protein